jgi:hypothetical protein
MATDKWDQPFPITSVCRADLRGILTEKEIARLDDADMEWIASKMADAYCDNGFWIDLKIIAEAVIEEKRR